MEKNYIYIIFDLTIKGKWIYKEKTFTYKPIYVGMGSGCRYKRHLTTKLHKCETNFTKHKMIKSLIESGNKPLSIKIYEDINREDAKNIEKDLIKHFGKIIDNSGILTNITDGGEETPCNSMGSNNIHSKKVYQYDLDGNFIKEWNCGLREIGRILGKNYNNIGDCCRGKTKTSGGYQWSYEYKTKLTQVKAYDNKSCYKKVYKFNYLGDIVNVYESLTIASFENNTEKSILSSVILNKKNHHNFMYSYDINFRVDFSRISHFHKIEVNGEVIDVTNKEIMKMFNVSRYYFGSVKSGKIKNGKFKIIY
jgi:hypothetical protein